MLNDFTVCAGLILAMGLASFVLDMVFCKLDKPRRQRRFGSGQPNGLSPTFGGIVALPGMRC